MKSKLYLILLVTLVLGQQAISQVVQRYGPVLHYTHTWNKFDALLNTSPIPGTDYSTATTLIKGENGQGIGTFILDIGDHNGTNTGVNAFRFIVFNLDSSGKRTTYRAIEVRDTAGNVIQGSLGRSDGTGVYGPEGKIYLLTYGLGKYLIEFDQNTYKAIAYKVPAGLAELFIASAGPTPDSTNPKTLIYGGTFNASQVWWFDPSNPKAGIQFVQFEIDGRQNYIHGIAGKGDWIYAKMTNRSLAGDAYRSLYAVNTKTQTKYLLFHSTRANFDVKGFQDNQRPGENNIFLVLTGKSPGTIYTNPTPILMSTPPPSNVQQNCPCYNIDPAGTYWKFPYGLRTKYFQAPYYAPTELTNNKPEYTIYLYNENYAWDKSTHQPFVDPPVIDGQFICNPNIDNGSFVNVPWDLRKKFPNIPSSSYQYYFRITGEKVDVNGAIEDGNHAWLPWKSYDPMEEVVNKPQTSWDNNVTLTYQFPGKPMLTKSMGYFTHTGNPNDLRDYDANLTGLSMTASSGNGWPYGAATLVKGEKKEGWGVVTGVPVSSANPLGYTHTLYGTNVNESEDIISLGEGFPGNKLATHMISGYPGDIEVFDYSKPIQYSPTCRTLTASTGLSSCNPRLVAKMYPLEIVLPSGLSQYGPQTSVGARIYSPNYYQPDSNNQITYKVIAVGTAGRARQGKYSAIGINNFKYNETTGEIVSPPGSYKIVDRIQYPYFDYYTPICITNEAVPVNCMKQQGILRNINSAYNEGKGYYLPANTSSCNPAFLKTLISVRTLSTTNAKNQIWLFNPATEKIVNTLDLPDPELNLFPIEFLKTVGDFYMGKTTGCDPVSGKCVHTIFLFKIKAGKIDSASIVKFKNPIISYIVNYTVTENINDFKGSGKIFKVFFSYRDNVNNSKIASFDIIAGVNRNKLSFGPMVTYSHPDNVDIRDFAYVPKQGVSTTDLFMVGGKNLYILKDVVPVRPDSVIARPAPAEIVANKSASVYPNPFFNEISINTGDLSAGTYNIRLINNTGAAILSQKIIVDRKQSTHKITVPASLNSGLYIVQLTGNEISTSFKLVKQ